MYLGALKHTYVQAVLGWKCHLRAGHFTVKQKSRVGVWKSWIRIKLFACRAGPLSSGPLFIKEYNLTKISRNFPWISDWQNGRKCNFFSFFISHIGKIDSNFALIVALPSWNMSIPMSQFFIELDCAKIWYPWDIWMEKNIYFENITL